MRELLDIRNDIDKVDKQLVKLLEDRFKLVKEVGDYKKVNNLPILDLNREKQVLASKKDLLTKKEEFVHYEKIFQLIMDIAKEIENE